MPYILLLVDFVLYITYIYLFLSADIINSLQFTYTKFGDTSLVRATVHKNQKVVTQSTSRNKKNQYLQHKFSPLSSATYFSFRCKSYLL